MAISEIIQFTDVLNDLQVYDGNGDPGFLLDVLNRELERLAKASYKTNKITKLTFELSLEPERRGTMLLVGKVNSKEPRPQALPMEVYTDNRGKLYGEDPFQQKLPFSSVSEIAAEPNS